MVALVFVVGCSSDNDPVSTVNWEQCDTEELQCATLSVPTDYKNRDKASIEIALIRHKASSASPLGSLLFNPGGPGGSGVGLVREYYEQLPDVILQNYHIVGFDPRGVGASTPVDCSEFGLDEINDYPLNADSIAELYQDYATFADKCSVKYGDYLQHLGSLNVVRDMEEIRLALAESKLNFIGYSYGTRLAALYLQEYAATSGRIILDASVPPDSTIMPLLVEALPSMQRNIVAALSQCVESDPMCDVDSLYSTLNNKVRSLVTDESGQTDSEMELDFLATIVIESALSQEFGALAAESLIEYLETGDDEVLESFVVFLTLLEGADDDSEDSEGEGDDSETAEIAILCADDATRYTTDELIGSLEEFNRLSDLFAELQLADLALCSGWPQALEPLSPIAATLAPVSLVIGGTGDAQTPLQWSEQMAQSIGGVFIRSEHDGHTAVFNGESDCVDDLVEEFLIDGVVPVITSCDD